MGYADLEAHFLDRESNTDFSAALSKRGGYITFSNSGRRGTKYFSLGIDSLIQCFKDILNNIDVFKKGQNYEEKQWRNFSQYFTDNVAQAMLTVQTKPLFSTLTKISGWANNSLPESEFTDNYFKINSEIIRNSITELEKVAEEFKPQDKLTIPEIKIENFDISLLLSHLEDSNLTYSLNLLLRFYTSVITKPFLVLTGLSGSGKTKLAQAFAKWIIEDKDQLNIVSVGADWTNREPLLGYPNALENKNYVLPESGVLQLILNAQKDPERPYFLILDEMNLSHVERYFADLSKEEIKLHSGDEDELWNGVPSTIKEIPKNLFIIGTVNIDETTYMFSPKVLDRANVIEFRVSKDEMKSFLEAPADVDLSELEGKGVGIASDFVKIATNSTREYSDIAKLSGELIQFFENLAEVGAEFGYRTANEINRFASLAEQLADDWEFNDIMDAAISQKLLPKLHGSRRKLEKVLFKLGNLCYPDSEMGCEELFKKPEKINEEVIKQAKYPISFEKIVRMHKGLIENGFTSFAEA